MPHIDDIRTELNTPWSLKALASSRLPAMLGRTCDPQALETPAEIDTPLKTAALAEMVVEKSPQEAAFYSAEGLYIEDMPIKFPHQPFYVPHSVWANFGRVLMQILEVEKQLNPHWDDCYLYLTIQQSHVAPGASMWMASRRPASSRSVFNIRLR